MLTIRPNPRAYMCGSAARASRNGASSITARISRNFSGGNSCTGATCCRPAQFTSTSAWPASAAASKSAARSTTVAFPPIRSATAVAALSLRSATTTVAPSAASRVAQASPIPLAPPVTTASRPASSLLMTQPAPRRRGAPGPGARNSPVQIYPDALARRAERLYPPPAGHRVHRSQPVQRGGAQPGAVQRGRVADRDAQQVVVHGQDDRKCGVGVHDGVGGEFGHHQGGVSGQVAGPPGVQRGYGEVTRGCGRLAGEGERP